MVKLAVVGAKNSGKTAVLEGLISYLDSKGYRVATVKHTSHRHRFDTPGKDSYRHRQAGAGLTIAESGEEIAIFARPDLLSVSDIQNWTHDNFDIWLIEGDRHADHPKIMVTRELDEFSDEIPKNIVATIGPGQIDGISSHFDSGDLSGLVDFIINTVIDRKAGIQQ